MISPDDSKLKNIGLVRALLGGDHGTVGKALLVCLHDKPDRFLFMSLKNLLFCSFAPKKIRIGAKPVFI